MCLHQQELSTYYDTGLPYFCSYHISSVIRQSYFPSKQSQKSRSIFNRSRSLGLFKKDKTRIIAKFHRTDLVICNHSREGKTPVL